MTNTTDAWGIKMPDGTLIPAATFEEDALFDMIGIIAGDVPSSVTRWIMEREGYKSVRVKITEVED